MFSLRLRVKDCLFVTDAFDNSKNPVACFEGLGSIFRGHGEKGTGMQEKPEASREQAFTFV